MAWYGQIAAMIFLIALIEAVVFGVSHFQKIRNRKQGWKARLAPRQFSRMTRSSGTLRVAEPVLVAGLILVAGFVVAFVWPLWMPFVASIVGYDVVCYLVHRWKVWKGIIAEDDDDDDDDGDVDQLDSKDERPRSRRRRDNQRRSSGSERERRRK